MGAPNHISGPSGELGPDADVSALELQQDTADSGAKTATEQKAPKKRSKAGSCRQRRIKCGEEKPICNNCVKSKRECKGYAQRLIFKSPLGIVCSSNAQAANAQMQSMPSNQPLPSSYDAPAFSQPRPADSHQPILAPKPAPFPMLEQGSFPTAIASEHQESDGTSTLPVHYLPGQGRGSAVSESSRVSGVPVQTLFHGKLQELPPNVGGTYQLSHVGAGPVDYCIQCRQRTGTLSHSDSSNVLHRFPTSATAQTQQQSHLYQPIPMSPPPSRMEYDPEGDDYYDIESEEELEDQTSAENFNQLNLIMASANRDQRQLRSFTTYLNEPNVLASYYPTLGSSPLNNPKTARIFLHFIHSTGPSLSIFERHPIDPSTMFGAPVSPAQQGLWTYTLPFKALEHQALLQTILALSSLHISYLQEAPPTVSLKHYHYALKRVGVAVGLPMRRKQIGTLAAALLLAYYEVMCAEHYKWNSHVAGSAQLVREIDFAGLTRDLRAHRRRVVARRKQTGSGFSFEESYLFGNRANEDDPFAEKENSIDEYLIGSLVGRAVNYDEFGQVEDGPGRSHQKHFTRKDIENIRIQCDLYWWYCKQDIIHGMISGSGLLKRKLKAGKVAGSEWKPDSELYKFMARFAMSSPDRQKEHPQNTSPCAPAAPPSGSSGANSHPSDTDITQPGARRESPQAGGSSMYGMIPSSGPRCIPPAFADTADRSSLPNLDDEDDESESYSEAEQEWERILAAFDTFANAIGPDFMPLPSDSTPPISSPFGTALQYRTQTIAVVWGFYYAGRTLLYRLHPCMPPAMMVAAGVAAAATANYAQIIGRIAAGIYYPQLFNREAGSLSPTLGSCLIEITVPSFFAGVQYSDAAQREWIITKLRDISRLTGWKSADAVANGCESAWVAAARQGYGPPYKRSSELFYQPSPPVTQRPAYANSERRFIATEGSSWAMGILSLDDDMQSLRIAERE
ncbi:hypothetical protein EYZ11_002804 [Aspergillus tanneri]|uniref:Zn(2)-C6 fungal-type domain-containing protein n=1 Tax=Aspergillus tanneri TaxID=1220188 RepID=A0A4S3JRX9_9EURO|nr:hypothetical protein EYZ11_002804 [Aspergillus tanneri]